MLVFINLLYGNAINKDDRMLIFFLNRCFVLQNLIIAKKNGKHHTLTSFYVWLLFDVSYSDECQTKKYF